MFPRSAGPDPTRSGTFRRRVRRAAADRRPRLRRPVSAADSSDRLELPQGAEQQPPRRRRTIPAARGRSDRRTAATPRSNRAWARWRISTRSATAAERLGLEIALDLAWQMFAGSSVGARAPGMVPPPAGRHDQVRRESAEEISGHLSARLRVRGLAGAVGGAVRRHARSGSSAASGSSASTTRTPKRSASGSG